MNEANLDAELPQPDTVLAIRGAIAVGRQGGPRPPDGSWLTEFWEIGRIARNAADTMREAIAPFQRMVGDESAHLQDHINALEHAVEGIDGIYQARFENAQVPADSHD
jgi:hypothetical protein